MDDYIIKDNDGNLLISIQNNEENALLNCQYLTHCLAVVKVNNDYLLGWNKWRKRWEIFGGCIEKYETARECIARECFEELGIQNVDFKYIGNMKLLLMPDYFSQEERIEHGALYGVTLESITIEEIFNQIKDREEITKLALYSQVSGKEPISQIDEKLLEYY